MTHSEAQQALREIELVSLTCIPPAVRIGDSYTVRFRFRQPLREGVVFSFDQWNHDPARQEFSQVLSSSDGLSQLNFQFWAHWEQTFQSSPPRFTEGDEECSFQRLIPVAVHGFETLRRTVPTEELLAELRRAIAALTVNSPVRLQTPFSVSVDRGGVHARLSGDYRPLDVGVDLPLVGDFDLGALGAAEIEYIDLRICARRWRSEPIVFDYDHFNVHVDFPILVELGSGGTVEFVENWIERTRVPAILQDSLLRTFTEFVQRKRPTDVVPRFILSRVLFTNEGLHFEYRSVLTGPPIVD